MKAEQGMIEVRLLVVAALAKLAGCFTGLGTFFANVRLLAPPIPTRYFIQAQGGIDLEIFGVRRHSDEHKRVICHNSMRGSRVMFCPIAFFDPSLI